MKSVSMQIAKLAVPVTLTKSLLKKSLEEIENDYWGEPTFPSGLVIACHKIRTLPLNQLTIGQLRKAIGQKMSLPYLVPMAVAELKIDPLVEGDFFEGDLLQNVLRVDDEYFEWDKCSTSSVLSISEQAAKILRAKELEYGDDELLALADKFIGKYSLKFTKNSRT